jgi:hypothetical protein
MAATMKKLRQRPLEPNYCAVRVTVPVSASLPDIPVTLTV